MQENLKNKTLIIGSSSFIGKYLSPLFPDNCIYTYNTKKVKNGVKFDISNDCITKILENNNIEQVLLIAGVTNFKEISSNTNHARSINVDNMLKIINNIILYGSKIIFFSSESVFNGNIGLYKETDKPHPRFLYGAQKYEVEQHIKKHTNNYLILRIAKVFSSNFFENTLITNLVVQLSKNKTILIAKDNIFNPIYINDCVKIIKTLINQKELGIFNICSRDCFSRLDMINLVLERYTKYKKFTGKINVVKLNSIQGAEQLPINTSLNYSKTYKATGIKTIPLKDISQKIVDNFFNKPNDDKYE